MTPFALSAIKYGLFALLFLFIWRSMRWAVRGLTVEPAPSGRRAKKNGNAPPAPTGPTTVVVHPPDGKPRSLKLAASMTIGRGTECELLIDDTYASSQHARLFGKNDVVVRGGSRVHQRNVRERPEAGFAGHGAAG